MKQINQNKNTAGLTTTMTAQTHLIDTILHSSNSNTSHDNEQLVMVLFLILFVSLCVILLICLYAVYQFYVLNGLTSLGSLPFCARSSPTRGAACATWRRFHISNACHQPCTSLIAWPTRSRLQLAQVI